MLTKFFIKDIYKYEKKLCLYGIAAALAGFLNGFIGTGGGVLILLMLKKLCPEDEKTAYSTVIFVTLPMALISACIYGHTSNDAVYSALPYLIPAAAGGALGTVFHDKIKTRALSAVFSVMLIVSGVLAVIK